MRPALSGRRLAGGDRGAGLDELRWGHGWPYDPPSNLSHCGRLVQDVWRHGSRCSGRGVSS
jgi:hypothetical protein